MKEPSVEFSRRFKDCLKGHTPGDKEGRWTLCLACGVHYETTPTDPQPVETKPQE